MTAPAFRDSVLIGICIFRRSGLSLVHETVPSDRGRLASLLRRRYRMGQTHASLIARGRSRAGRIKAAGIATCGGLANPAWRNRQLMRGALHLGAVSHLGGARQIEIYGTAPDGSDTDPRSGRKEN